MSDFFDPTGKVAVVTGGTSGIGLATARRLTAAGALVAIAGRRSADELARSFGARAFACDVSSEDDVQMLMHGVKDAFGRLDIDVKNAGVTSGYSELTESETKEFEATFKVNTMGVANGIKHAAMKDGGAIVNVSSVAGIQGVACLAPYVASKWAVIGLTRTVAMELGSRGIRFNAVCPLSVNTPMAHAEGGEAQLAMEHKAVPMGRTAEPEEIAALIHFLVPPDCNFVNGQAIAADGGFTAGMRMTASNTLAAE